MISRGLLICLVAAGLLATTCCGRPAERPGAGARPGRVGATGSSSPTPTPGFRPRTAVARTLGWRLPAPVAREVVIADRAPTPSVVVAGGMLASDVSTGHSYRLSLDTGRVHDLPHLGVPVHDAAAGLYAERPAVFGGGNAVEQSLVQQLAAGGWRVVDRLPTTRSDLSAVTVAGATLVIGGYDGLRVPLAILRQSRTGPLRAFGSLRVGVRYAATARLGRFVYVIGGEVDHQELGVVQRVDVATGRTTVVGRLPRPLGHAQAVGVGGRVLLMGGRTDPDTRTAAMWWLDPTAHRVVRLTRAGRLPEPLSDAAVVSVGHDVWLLGVEEPGVTDHVVRVALS